MIIAMDPGKTFNKMLYPFMIKALTKLGIHVNFLNLIKSILKKHPTGNTICKGERLNSFP